MKQKLLLALLALFTLGGSNLFAQTWTGNEVAAGDFYLYNVGSQKFLNVGDPSTGWGTHAYLTPTTGIDVTLTSSDGKYTIDTKFSNGGESHYLAANCWADGASLAWTFTPVTVDGINYAYSISNDGNYLAANTEDIYGGTTVNTVTELSENAYWVLISKLDLMDNMKKTASKENPVDATFIIKSANFDRNDTRNSWTQTHSGGNFTFMGKHQESWGSQTLVDAGNSNFYGIEAYGNSYDINQVLEGLPAGTYEFTCQGFDNSGTNTSYIYAGSQEKAFTITSPGTAALSEALENIAKGQYTGNTTGTFNIAEDNSSITVGFKRPNSGNWAVIDNARLLYYGLDLSEFEAALAESVSKANAAAEELNGNVPTAVYNKLTNAITENNKTYTTAIDYTNAANAIDEEVSFAQSFVKPYSRYKNVKAAVLAISNTINTAEADSKADAAITLEAIDDAVLTLRNALTAYLPNAQLGDGETIDLTNALIDNAAPGISGTLDYWTNSGSPSLENQLYEYWNVKGATTKQTIASTLPAGNYKLSAIAYTRDNMTATLNAGTNSTKLVGCGTVNNRTQGNTWIAEGNGVNNLVFNLSEATPNLEIGLTADNSTSDYWMCWRSFSLVYGDVFEPYTLVEGKMNADVSAAQTDAENNYKNNPSPATYQALMNAIAAAQASKDAYATAKTAIEKANNIKTNHNLATEDAITTFAAAIADIEFRYNDGTLADADANNAGTTLGTAVSGWHANANGAAVKYLNNGFSLNDFDQALYVNTWSTEGATDGSNFEVPFYEYWTDNANSLGEKTWTGSLTGIDNGLYKVSAWVRVRAKNETSVDDATGITMDVNGGTAVDVTEGTQVGETQFQLATYEAEGLVKDGNLTVNFNIAADNNISWLSFQNVKYEKVRDLTPEEQAVTPTGITLDKTEVTLTATDNSVTLTPTFDPENATTTVTWTTSDANIATVADGVVTGVAPGTATITVASTLNADVKATCTVTVSYPETEVASDDYVNEGAKRTVVSYGDNLIKNGAFEYPNSFYGWTTGSGVAMSADNFDLITEENNHYIKAKGHTGATGVNSIGTEWAIEAGKTYVFGYQVKSTSAGNSEFHVVSLTNELGNETSKISENSTAVGTDWTNVKYKFTNTDNYAYVQFRARWLNSAVSFDNFYLVEVVDEEVIGNVQYALDAIPTTNIGTGAFQYSQSAIDAANALVQGTATVEDVENAYAAVTTINAPAEGQLFNVVLTYDGWTYDKKAMTYIANGRTDGGNYNIQYKEEANQNLAQAFTFTKVEGNNYKMSQIDADGVARYISTGQPYGGNASQIRTTTNADDALLVTVIPTATEGKWNLRNTTANQFIGSQDAGVFTVNSHIDFVLKETQKPSITINTTAAGWGTTILPFAAQKPADVKVYSCAEMNGSDLVLTEVEALEANKPYVIEGAWNETLTGDAQGTQLTYEADLLTGVYAQTQAAAGTYVMQKLNGNVAFYKVSEEKPINVPANRAYLTGVSSEAKVLNIGNGETNGINAIQALIDGDAEIFNVNGVKQNSLQKGINIIKMSNGETRKIMVK